MTEGQADKADLMGRQRSNGSGANLRCLVGLAIKDILPHKTLQI